MEQCRPALQLVGIGKQRVELVRAGESGWGSVALRCSSWALLGPGKQRVDLVRAGKVGGAVSQYFEHYTGEELLEFVIFEHVGCIEKFGNRRAEIRSHSIYPLQKKV